MTRSFAAAVIGYLRAREPTSDAWGIVVEEAGEGYARIRMVLRKDMLNAHGNAHGGIIYAFADTAFGYACNSRNRQTVGAEASIIYLAPAAAGDILIAEAREVAMSGRSGIYDVSVRTNAGGDIAFFRGYSRTVSGTFLDEASL